MPLTFTFLKTSYLKVPWPLFNYKAVDDHTAHYDHGHMIGNMIVITVL